MPKLSPEDWRDILQLDARERRSGLPSGLLTSVLVNESGGDPDATSPVGAAGLFQFMPGTAKDFGINPRDPFQSADAAERYLSQLHRRYDGDTKKALAAYNWGPGNVDKNGVENLPRETSGYLRKVLGWIGPKSAEAASPQPQGGSFVDSPTFEAWLAQGRSRGQQAAQAPEMPPRQQAAVAAPETPGLPAQTPGIQRITVDVPYGEAPPAAPTAAATPQVPLNAQGQVTNEDALRLQDAQIAQAMGYDPQLLMRSSNYRPGMLLDIQRRGIYAGSPGGIGAQAYEQPSTLGNLALRAGHGLASVATGANQLLQTGLQKLGLANQGDVALADVRAKQMEQQRQAVTADSPAGLGFVAEMAGNLAAPLPIPAVGGRLVTAAARGAAGATLTQPALQVSANPAERDTSFLREKGAQAAIGAVAGATLDTAGRGLAALGRLGVSQSRGQKALEAAETANQQRVRTYAGQIDDTMDNNIAALNTHLQKLETYERKVQRFGAQEAARGHGYDTAVAEKLTETNAANAAAKAQHASEVLATQQANIAAQKGYTEKIANQARAVEGAKAVPGKYKGPDVGEAYQTLRQQSGSAMVDMVPAQGEASSVLEQLGMHATMPHGSPLARVATKIRELGNTAAVADLVPLMQDAGKLTRAGDGQTRGMARGLFVGLHDALEASAREMPETDAARKALLDATGAARRNFAVGDLEDIVRLATGRNSTGEFKTLNIAQILRNLERRFAGDSPRDKLFTNSFTPEERVQILGDFERFAGLQPIPSRPPTLAELPTAPQMKAANLPEPPRAREVPIALEQPPRRPTLATLPEPPEMARPQLEPLSLSKLARRALYGAGAGWLGNSLGVGGNSAVLAGAAVSAEVGAQLFAKALLNPRLRPIILQAVSPDGSVDPRVYGYLANQFTQDRSLTTEP